MSSASVASLPPSSPSSARMMQRASPAPKYQHLNSYIAPAPFKPAPLLSASSSPSPLTSQATLSPSPSIAASSVATASVGPKKDGGPLVQPKKEWVLPARAKPGRKPSVTEPLTKRKAQNRASQRAFRERKQSYLQELESKVAAYESADIDRSVELQKLAQKLSLENEGLRKELTAWKEKAMRLDDVVKQMQSNGRVSGISPSLKAGPGCKAPSHEKSILPKRSVLSAPGAKTKEKGEVRFADDAHPANPIVALPLPKRQTSHGTFPPPRPSTTSTHEDLSLASAEATKSVWSTESNVVASPPNSGVGKTKPLTSLSPPLLPSHRIPIEGGCGFCTEASPCVCAGDFFDLSGATTTSPSTSPKPNDDSLAFLKRRLARADESSNRMSIPSLTTQAPHAPEVSRHKKLWYTVQAEQNHVLPMTTNLRHAHLAKTKKLWYTTEAPVSKPAPAEPTCTGDPSTCGACSTDPGLAAFCEAVTTAASAPQSHTDTSAPPLAASGNHSGSALSATSSLLLPPPSLTLSSRRETIPSAWRQIRSHPRFSQWQGGLDLLAEVVSKRSGSVHSPLLAEAKLAQMSREGSIDIEPARLTQLLPATSNDRATSAGITKSAPLPSMSETGMYTSTKGKREYEDGERSDTNREKKKQRILIDREAVQEALAMLDAGTLAQPRFAPKRTQADVAPCPCPWRPGDKHTG